MAAGGAYWYGASGAGVWTAAWSGFRGDSLDAVGFRAACDSV